MKQTFRELQEQALSVKFSQRQSHPPRLLGMPAPRVHAPRPHRAAWPHKTVGFVVWMEPSEESRTSEGRTRRWGIWANQTGLGCPVFCEQGRAPSLPRGGAVDQVPTRKLASQQDCVGGALQASVPATALKILLTIRLAPWSFSNKNFKAWH